MSQLTQKWQQLAVRVDAMTLRERAMIFLATALVLIAIINTLLIEPLSTRQQKLSHQIVETQAKTSALQLQTQTLVMVRSADPDAPLRARMAKLEADSAVTGQALQVIQSGLVAPQQMPVLLEDIMRRNHGLRLVALQTLPVENLATTLDVAGPKLASHTVTAPELAVFKHGVEITVEGSYADLLQYLTTMESSPWRMFWSKAVLTVDTYPKTTLTLRLHTLSLDKAWLTI
jgi:MSHA biogenesis protein MshJ